MGRRPVFLIIVPFLLLLSFSFLPEKCTVTSSGVAHGAEAKMPASPNEEWLLFRNAFPLHMQTLAVSRPYPDKTRTLIVSEPPPHVKVPDLIKVDAKKLAKHEIKQWTIGFDGWVKDLVFTLPEMTDAEVAELQGKLSEYLFHTDYKAYALPLPVNFDELKTKYPLDIQVSTADLEGFFEEKFAPLAAKEVISLRDAPEGVYQSEQPGLIAWVFPKANLQDKAADIRKFALDSDLILGAITRGNQVVMFGRERVAPLTVLPPLRTEMIVTLAATEDKSLGQSYERVLYGAGSSHARWDWAPIYLSPELLDTEYGSILNNTDQMLKGWSSAGGIEYYNFPCVFPGRYPFDKPLVKLLGGSGVQFNWNTVGFGIVANDGSRSIYATNRTGALPVIYRPHKEGMADPALPKPELTAEAAEERGYSCYCTLNDPLLAKAVQYTAVYQVFTAFDIAAAQTQKLPKWSQSAALNKLAKKVMEKFHDAADKDINSASDRFVADTIERHGSAVAAGEKSAKLDKKILDLLPLKVSTKCGEWQESYRAFVKKHGNKGIEAVARELATTRETVRDPVVDFQFLDLSEDGLTFNFDTRAQASVFRLGSLPQIIYGVQSFQKEFSASRTEFGNPWIRTPTVVWSRALGTLATFSGGHSLDAKVTGLRRNVEVPQGEVRLTERGIEYNPADASRVERSARLLARSKDPNALKQTLTDVIKRPSPTGIPPTRNMLLASLDTSRTARGAQPSHFGGGSGKGPPKLPPVTASPPPPPGSQPPGDLPQAGTGAISYIAGSKQILSISRQEGKVTIRRQSEVNGKATTEGEEVWGEHNLIAAIRSEFEAGGRTHDREPLRLSLDKSFELADIDRFTKNLELHLTRSTGERVVVIKTERAPQPNRFKSATSYGKPKFEAVDGDSTLISGNQKVEVANGHLPLEYKVLLASPGKEVTADKLEASANKAGKSVGEATDLLPMAIYDGFITDFDASADRSRAWFRYGGIGDQYRVEIEHKGGTSVYIVWTDRQQP